MVLHMYVSSLGTFAAHLTLSFRLDGLYGWSAEFNEDMLLSVMKQGGVSEAKQALLGSCIQEYLCQLV
jgi:hypothetical protein